MAEQCVQRRLAAILIADVVGYSRMMEADEAGTLAALKEQREAILEPTVKAHGGRIVKVMGDGVLVEFGSAVNAVQAAIELQKEMTKANDSVPEGRRIKLRIGINLGDVIGEGSDIYGDGVNIAARLQAMAEPGGINISGGVYEQIGNKLLLAFEDLGLCEVKNITRPIHVFRLRGVSQEAGLSAQPASAAPRPTIALLPFKDLSGDLTQGYLVDGLTENIIAGLSRFHDLSVIASNSTFAYKGKSVRIQDVSRELGARYILEGSLQKTRDAIRTTAQLIDGATGQHLWTGRYDRKTEDIFTVLDEVTDNIVATLASGYGGRLSKSWRKQRGELDKRTLKAFDYFTRGLELSERFTENDNRQARGYLEKAIEIEPNYGRALAKLAWTHSLDAIYGWSANAESSWGEALRFATLSVERDDDEAWGHWALGGYYRFHRRHDLAVREYQRAIELNPNDADVLADFGYCLAFAGRPNDGMEMMLKAMRLNPHHPDWYTIGLAIVYFGSRRYEEVIVTFEGLHSLSTVPDFLYLAASHAFLGHGDEARASIEGALKLDPQATIRKWASTKNVCYKNPEDLEHYKNGLRMAGLPE